MQKILFIVTILLITFSYGATDRFSAKVVPKGLYFIPKGDDLDIIDTLIKEGLPLKRTDCCLIKLAYNTPKEGWIRITKPITIKELLIKIGNSKREKTRKVFFYSSDTVYDFSLYFSKLISTTPIDVFRWYKRLAKYKEANIIASVYHLPYNISTKTALYYMINRSEKIFKTIAQKYGIKYPSKEFKKYLIIASILQKESWIDEEMPKISAVIHNRLKLGMRLQMDATLNYGRFSHTVVTPQRIRSDRSRYNTYKYKGLPPEPLGSVTPQALEAAFNPSKADYIYFVQNIYGKHTFSSSYKEHLANICKIKTERAKIRLYKRFLTMKGGYIKIVSKDRNQSSSARLLSMSEDTNDTTSSNNCSLSISYIFSNSSTTCEMVYSIESKSQISFDTESKPK